MPFRLVLPLLLLSLAMPSLKGDAIKTYFEAQKLKKAGDEEEYYRLNVRLIEEGQAEGLPHYAFFGAFYAAYTSYRELRVDDCLSQAAIGIEIYEMHKNNRNLKGIWFAQNHIGLWNLTERCHSMQLRPGEGWLAQKKATALWHELVNLPYSPGSFDVEAINKLEPVERANGWRHIGRYANYLHDFGRTTQARELLQKAIAQNRQSKAAPSVYSTQLLSTLGLIESFIGYKESAINLFTEEIAQIKQLKTEHQSTSIHGAKLNLIRARSNYEGVTEELVDEARDVVAAASKISPRRAATFQRTITTLQNMLDQSSISYEELEKLAREALANGQDLEAFYLNRNALFLQSQGTDKNLDSHFNELLGKTRSKGIKRSEPRIYRRYGDWLVSRNRFAEAITIYQEALSLTRTFEWHPMMSWLYGRLGLAYQMAGEQAAADAIWSELEAYLRDHPDIPVRSKLVGYEFQLSAYLRAGREEEARALIRKARSLKHEGGLKELWLKPFTDEAISNFRASLKKETPVAVEGPVGEAALQPRSLRTTALPGTNAGGVFHLINHGAAPLSGTLAFTGPGATIAGEHTAERPAFWGDLTKTKNTVEVPLTINGGTYLAIPVTLPFHDLKSGDFTLTWTPKKGEPVSAKWNGSWGSKISEAIVLDSAKLSVSPFIGVPVIHHLGFPEDDQNPRSIRIKGSVPLRVEYRDAESGDLLAIDADGNGSFTGEGEFAVDSTNRSAPEITPIKTTRTGKIEVWLFPLAAEAWTQNLELKIELNDGNGWVEFGTDTLEVGP